MPFEELEPRTWPWLKEARKLFSIPFSRSSSSTFFSGFTISWSLLTFGLPFLGNAPSPISSHSQVHLPSVESFMPSSSDRSLTVVSPDRTTFAAEASNACRIAFFFGPS